MNIEAQLGGLESLYLESIFGVKIGPLNHRAAEFEGHIDFKDIERLCDEGMIFWQNPEAPRTGIAYVCASMTAGVLDIAIDPATNTIVVS